MSLNTVLQVSGLAKHFGGVRALDGVDFSVSAGQCVALIGPNGAGKSTCFACLAGQQVPTAGEVLWQGQSLLGKPPAERQRLGVAGEQRGDLRAGVGVDQEQVRRGGHARSACKAHAGA